MTDEKPFGKPVHSIHYIEFVTPDTEKVRAIYEQAYGWRFDDPVPELGNASVAELPDGGLFGIRAPMQSQESPAVRIYARVTDLRDAVAKAKRLGAEMMLEEMEIPGRGRIAIYSLGGLEHGIWQPA